MKFTIELSEHEQEALESLYDDLADEGESMDAFFGRVIEEWLLPSAFDADKKEEEAPYRVVIPGTVITDKTNWITPTFEYTWTGSGTSTTGGYIAGGNFLPLKTVKTGMDELKEKEDKLRELAIGWYAPATAKKDPNGWRAPTKDEILRWEHNREDLQRSHEWTGKQRPDGSAYLTSVRAYTLPKSAFGEWRSPTSAEVMHYEMNRGEFLKQFEVRTTGTGVLSSLREIKGK